MQMSLKHSYMLHLFLCGHVSVICSALQLRQPNDQVECHVLYSFNLHMAAPVLRNLVCIKSASSITLLANGLTQPLHACRIVEPGNILPVGERDISVRYYAKGWHTVVGFAQAALDKQYFYKLRLRQRGPEYQIGLRVYTYTISTTIILRKGCQTALRVRIPHTGVRRTASGNTPHNCNLVKD